jgi:hypothetical protein
VIGDYSHIKEGYDKAFLEFVTKKSINPRPISHIEIYSTGKTEAKYPSKWVTEIFIPVLSKIIPWKATPHSCKNPCYHKGRHSYRDAIEPAK